LLFHFALKYAIKKLQVSQIGLKLKEKLQSLIEDNDVNFLDENVNTITKITNFFSSQ